MDRRERPAPADRVRVAALVAAHHLAADLAGGPPLHRVVRSTLVAVRLAHHLQLDRTELATTYWVALLAGLGDPAATSLASGFGLGPGVEGALTTHADAQPDDGPDARELVPAAARAAGLARVGRVVANHVDDVATAADVLRRSPHIDLGGALARADSTAARQLLDGLSAADLAELSAAEPEPRLLPSGVALDRALAALGDRADTAGPATAGHARAVASLAAAAGGVAGLPGGAQRALRQAGWVHDLGRGAAPPDVWRVPDPPSSAAAERMRLVGHLTQVIVRRVPELTDVAALLAASRCATGADAADDLTAAAALLAAAHRYVQLGEPRAQRPGLSRTEAARHLCAAGRDGRLHQAAVDAVLCAADHPVHERPAPHPTAQRLTPREAEVLRLIARGATARRVGAELSITTKTASNHITRIYTKLGISSRAEAALFAVRHHLLQSLEPLDVEPSHRPAQRRDRSRPAAAGPTTSEARARRST